MTVASTVMTLGVVKRRESVGLESKAHSSTRSTEETKEKKNTYWRTHSK